jgi:GPH family glycoside/pentoside/hexuronide:cation symporter
MPASLDALPVAEAGVPGSAETVAPEPRPDRLATKTILLFSAPALGQGFMFLLTGMYLLKFSTDVLGIAPGVMGFLFLLSRVWDAISDPLAGYLSDRTRTRWGRRRPWLVVGAVPVGLVFYAMWAPPQSLTGGPALAVWMGGAIILFYTGMTIFNMPHDSLAAELTDSYDDRNRIFGIRRAFFGVGTVFVFAAIAWLSQSSDPRSDARIFAAVGAVVTTASMLFTGIRIRERSEFQGRGARRPFRAFAEVIRNPHARILLGVFFLQQVGVGAVTFMAAYYAQYIMGDPEFFAPMMGSLFVVSLLSIPVWVRIGQRYDKKSLLLLCMCVVGAALFSVGFFGEGDLIAVLMIASIAGFAVGGLDVFFPSIQADVIDYDELKSDERKEGVYFAAWAFASKTALGVSGMLAGLALSATGYQPGVEQPESVKLAIRALMSGIPLLTYGAGIVLFRRFSLTREAHGEIHTELARRRSVAARLREAEARLPAAPPAAPQGVVTASPT